MPMPKWRHAAACEASEAAVCAAERAGLVSLEMSTTPSVRLSSARHRRGERLRPRRTTAKTAVVKTFICETIAKVDASMCANERKPRIFITR